MWLDSSVDLLEAVKSSFPFTVVFILPFLMVISPVNGAQNFPVYRVNQFDIAGAAFGTRNTLVNMEARPLDSSVVVRRCIVGRLGEVTLEKFRTLVDKNAGALVILLPDDLSNLTAELSQEFMALERVFLTEEIQMPVYFAVENEEIGDLYNQIKSSSNGDASPTAIDALLQAVSANGFQMNVNVNSPKQLPKLKTLNLHGVLEGSGNADRLPTVMFVAHYDSFGAAPSLSYGANSNGSGVAALLELMRIFARMYSIPSSRADYNLVFLLSGNGKLNYFGTKKWLEEIKESSKFPYVSDVDIVICLDTIGKPGPLNIHVSKPPKPGSVGDAILKAMEMVAPTVGSSVKMIHKKINLGDPQLAWEHEQFAMNKMAGMTLSSLDNHKDPSRLSSLDIRTGVDTKSLATNTYIIGESVARFMFKLSSNNDVTILKDELSVQHSMMEAWLGTITSEPRAAQLTNTRPTVRNTLEQAFNRHLKSVAFTSFSCDQREPEFILYENAEEVMYIYNVKPAVFDLVLAAGIGVYLGAFYLASLMFPQFVTMVTSKTKKS